MPASNTGSAASRPVLTLYGIKNCDTMKKARAWLDGHQLAYQFHDYKASGIDQAHLLAWCRTFGWERVLNRAGTTFRKLPPQAQQDLNQAAAIELMLAQPSMIKRPILERGQPLLLGFDPAAYASELLR